MEDFQARCRFALLDDGLPGSMLVRPTTAARLGGDGQQTARPSATALDRPRGPAGRQRTDRWTTRPSAVALGPRGPANPTTRPDGLPDLLLLRLTGSRGPDDDEQTDGRAELLSRSAGSPRPGRCDDERTDGLRSVVARQASCQEGGEGGRPPANRALLPEPQARAQG
jgi:hypothetical protein